MSDTFDIVDLLTVIDSSEFFGWSVQVASDYSIMLTSAITFPYITIYATPYVDGNFVSISVLKNDNVVDTFNAGELSGQTSLKDDAEAWYKIVHAAWPRIAKAIFNG